MPAPAKAVDQQVAWKNAEIMAFAVALVRHALAMLDSGVEKFTTDIVPDEERGAGEGIAGSVVTMLKNAGLIVACGVWAGEKGRETFYAERVKSERADSKSRWIGVYKLAGTRNLAVEFLMRNRIEVKPTQPDLLTMPSTAAAAFA